MGLKDRIQSFFTGLYRSRFSNWITVLGLYMAFSLLIRIAFSIWSAGDASYSLYNVSRAYGIGFAYDLAVGMSFLFGYAVYLILLPARWIGSVFDRVCTYSYLSIMLFIMYFSLMAEVPFWEEFATRFNFIAVDYLIYTYEVVANINQSYPLPLLIGGMVAIILGTFWLLKKTGARRNTFNAKSGFFRRFTIGLPTLLLTPILLTILNNKQAEFSENVVVNEIGKNGVFSFFAAFRSNELDYDAFYPKVAESEVYPVLRQDLKQLNQTYPLCLPDDVMRFTKGDQTVKEDTPNIVLVVIESFSADFSGLFGNDLNLTPVYDSLAKQSVLFTNLFATGTRTVRGMEALTLCVPPTPGNSIVRRPDNDSLFSIGTILRDKKYVPYFIYGGDGYFDNMNNFFGGQGFTIVDRNRGNPLSDNIRTHRYNIPDEEVEFENAWGICDEDIYKQALKYADKSADKGRPFFQFIMTTSNHRPYTFPEGKIDLPQGERNSAVKYTDYALGQFIEAARKKPWFDNTVFVVVADHCASSAGRWEINIAKHHIPAIFYNLKRKPEVIARLTSQIDLMPTLFGYLNWSYLTELYGKDIRQTKEGDERAFIGNYRTLGMLKNDIFTQIDDRKRTVQFDVNPGDKSMAESKKKNDELRMETIAFYQTASERFSKGKMKEK